MPGNVHVEAWVDQADVLGEARLVVSSWRVGHDLRRPGRRLCPWSSPVFADQFANAPTVAQAGAGVQVHTGRDVQGRRRPAGREDAPRIRRAIETVLADDSYREAARAVAADMATAPAIGTLLGQLPRRH